MALQKCPKTLTGNHDWQIYSENATCYPYKRQYPTCIFCDMVDDRVKYKKLKIQKKKRKI